MGRDSGHRPSRPHLHAPRAVLQGLRQGEGLWELVYPGGLQLSEGEGVCL